MDDLKIPVPIRNNEQAQLELIAPAIRDRVEQSEVLDTEKFEAIADEVADWDGNRADSAYVRQLSLTKGQWQSLIVHMTRVRKEFGRNRVQYLQRKLMRRVRNRLEELQ